jgi:hypothetical protein
MREYGPFRVPPETGNQLISQVGYRYGRNSAKTHENIGITRDPSPLRRGLHVQCGVSSIRDLDLELIDEILMELS